MNEIDMKFNEIVKDIPMNSLVTVSLWSSNYFQKNVWFSFII